MIAPGIACYVDIENLIITSLELDLPIDLEPVIKKLQETGIVRVRRSYGDILKVFHSLGKREERTDQVRRNLHRNHFEIVDIPFTTQHKNAADIHLVVDALTVAFTNPQITHFAIVSSDRDYVPLFRKLRELGKTVIAVAMDQRSTNHMLREACDTLLFYDLLLGLAPAEDQEAQNNLRFRDFAGVLMTALKALSEQGRPLVGNSVLQQMRALRSDFMLQLTGCSTFTEFAEKAAEILGITVQVHEGSGDIQFSGDFTETRPVELPQPHVTPNPDITPEETLKEYEETLRGRLLEILRLPFPPALVRLNVLQHVIEAYRSLIRSGSFSLLELKDQAEMTLREQNLPCDFTYKMCLSLYFARCFSTVAGAEKGNPEIVGRAVNEDLWESRMYVNLIRQLSADRRLLDPRVLSRIFYETDSAETVRRCAELIDEARS